MDRPDESRFPDTDEENSEQADSGTQANDVADDARSRATDLAQDSERGGTPNPAQIVPDDTPDLVERMEEMNRSGRIDMDAFAGEPGMDDEDDAFGDDGDAEDLDSLGLPDED